MNHLNVVSQHKININVILNIVCNYNLESYRHRKICDLFHEGSLLCLLGEPAVTEGLKEKKVMLINMLCLSSDRRSACCITSDCNIKVSLRQTIPNK